MKKLIITIIHLFIFNLSWGNQCNFSVSTSYELLSCGDVQFISNIESGTAPYTYNWDFDCDGTIDSNEPNPVYNCLENGLFDFCLTITDAEGCNDAITNHLIIESNSRPLLFTCPANIIVDVNDSTEPAFTGNPTHDNCNVQITFNDNPVEWPTGERTIFRTWNASNSLGKQFQCKQAIGIGCPVDSPLANPQYLSCDSLVFSYGSLNFPNLSSEFDFEWQVRIFDGSGIIYTEDGNEREFYPPFVGPQYFYSVGVTSFYKNCPSFSFSNNFSLNSFFERVDTILYSNSPECFADYTPEKIFCKDQVEEICQRSDDPNLPFDAPWQLGTTDLSCKYTNADGDTLARVFYQVTVLDTISPAIICPTNATIIQGNDYSPMLIGEATSTEACDVEIEYSDCIVGECPADQFVYRNWTALDKSGNKSSCEQIIEITCDSSCIGPNFFKLYGDNQRGSIFKLEYKNGKIYALGSRGATDAERQGFLMELDMNGNIQWTAQFPPSYVFSDFIPSRTGFMLVGDTRPIGSTSKSVIAKVNLDGSLSWAKEYDFFSGRERLIRIVPANDPRSNPANPSPSSRNFMILGFTGNNFDNQNLLHIDENGNEIWRKVLDGNRDDQAHSAFKRLDNGTYLLTGQIASGGQFGHIDSDANIGSTSTQPGNGVRLLDIVEANNRIYVVGSDGTQGYMIILEESGTKRMANYTFPNLTRINRIRTDDNGFLYLLGLGDIDGNGDRFMVYKLFDKTETGRASDLRIEWVKYNNHGDTNLGGASILVADDNLIYQESRLNHPSGFGEFDDIIGVFDLDMTGECITELTGHTVVRKTNTDEFTGNYSISDLSFPISTDISLADSFSFDMVDLDCGICDTCVDFSNFDNWATFNVQSASITSEPEFPVIITALDDGTRSILVNDNDFEGNWFERYQNKCLCFDYKANLGGSPVVAGSNFAPQIRLYQGEITDANSWEDNATMVEFIFYDEFLQEDTWQNWCIPIAKSENGELPSDSYGFWQYDPDYPLPSDPAQFWDDLIEDVTGLIIIVDYHGRQTESVFFANFCASECPPCEPELSISINKLDCDYFILESQATGFSDQVTYSWSGNPQGFLSFSNPDGANTELSIWTDIPLEPEICLTVSDGEYTKTECIFIPIEPLSPPQYENCPREPVVLPINIEECYSDHGIQQIFAVGNCPISEIFATCLRSDGLDINDNWPVGSTTVLCSVEDDLGQIEQCNFEVVVVDNIAPSIICPPSPIAVTANPGMNGVIVNFDSPIVDDNCPEVTYFCDIQSGDFLECGEYTITCTAEDASLNTADCSFEVIIECEPSCCDDTEGFFDRFNEGFLTEVGECSYTLQSLALDSCDRLSIDWGDGNEEEISINEPFSHQYTASDDYTICASAYIVAEDGSICLSKDTCWSVCIDCDGCDNLQWQNFFSKSIASATGGISSSRTSHYFDIDIVNDFVYSGGSILGDNFDGQTITENGKEDAVITKHDLNGNLSWSFTIGGEENDGINTIKVDPNNGDIYVGGFFYSQRINLPSADGNDRVLVKNNETWYDGFMAKYDANQNLLWAYSFGSIGFDEVYDLVLDEDSNVIYTGIFWGNPKFYTYDGVESVIPPLSGSERSMFLLKLNSNGNHLWTKNYSSSEYIVFGKAIDVDEDNNIYVTGDFRGTVDMDGTLLQRTPGSNGENMLVAKYAPNGTINWAFKVGDANNDNFSHVDGNDLQVHDENLILTGFALGDNIEFNPLAADSKILETDGKGLGFLACYDLTTAENKWNFGIDNGGHSNDLSVAPNGDIAVAGVCRGVYVDFDPSPNDSKTKVNGYEDQYIAKYDKDGQYLNAIVLGGSDWDQGNTIEWDDDGNVFIMGRFNSSDFDPQPFDPTNSLLNSGASGGVFFGKYSCYCQPSEFCCDALSVDYSLVQTSEPRCCYALNIDNQYGSSITQINAELITDGWGFVESSLSSLSGFNWTYNSSELFGITHSSGIIPMGAIPELAKFCISPKENSVQNPAQIVVSWIAGKGEEQKVICRDTLLIECNETYDPGCVNFNFIDAACNPDNPLEYEVTYTVTNLGTTPANAIALENLPSGFIYGSCDNSNTSNVWFETINLAPGETSSELCVTITANDPVLSDIEISLTTGFIGPECCHSKSEQFFTLQPCCTPYEDISVDLRWNSECCYSLNLENDCSIPYFTAIELNLEGTGLTFASLSNQQPFDWSIDSTNEKSVWLFPNNYIQKEGIDNLLKFCLDGDSSTPEELEIKFYPTNSEGDDSVKCIKTLGVECKLDNNNCISVFDINAGYNSTSGLYDLELEVTNNSSFDAAYLIFTDPLGLGLNFTNDFLPLNPILNPSQSVTIQSTFSIDPSPFPDEFEIGVILKTIDNSDCCLGDTVRFVKVVDNNLEIGAIIYPNPFSEIIFIDFENPLNSQIKATLKDALGKEFNKVVLAPGSNRYQIQGNTISSGIYFIELQDNSGNVRLVKLVKN